MPSPISRISIPILLGILLTVFAFDSLGQQRSVLEKKKGFRDIKLRSNVEDYDFLTLATEGGLSYDMEFLDIDQENIVSETRQFENVNTKYDEVDVYYVNPGTENYLTIDGGTLSKIFISTIKSNRGS